MRRAWQRLLVRRRVCEYTLFNLEGATYFTKEYGSTLCDEKESPRNPETNGGVAQLGEHLPCTQGVRGSIPLISTICSCTAWVSNEGVGTEKWRPQSEELNGLIAQVVRARA